MLRMLDAAAQGTVAANGTCTLTSCSATACQCTIANTLDTCYTPPNYGVGNPCTYYPQPTSPSAGCVTTAQT